MKNPMTKFAAKLFVYNLAGTIVSLVCMLPVVALASQTQSIVLQFAINALFVLVLFSLLWKVASDEGQKNFMRQRIQDAKAQEDGAQPEEQVYTPWKGYIAGAMAQALPFLLMVLYLPLGAVNETAGAVTGTLLRGYFIMYSQLVIVLEGGVPWIFLIPMAVSVLASGLGYQGGARQYQKVVSIIRRHDQKRAQKKPVPAQKSK